MGFLGNLAQARAGVKNQQDQQAVADQGRQTAERQKMLEMALQIRGQNNSSDQANARLGFDNKNLDARTAQDAIQNRVAELRQQLEDRRMGLSESQAAETLRHNRASEAQSAGAADRTLVPVQHEDGSVIYTPRQQAVGQHAPSPNARGTAAIMKDVASNQTQLSVIDDAVRELDGHPSAVGLARGAADLPLIGGAADALNQRLDPGGVAARASLANVSSLVIKDRSGSAVTISESARLRPFIPSTGDTPEAIRIKLRKLKSAIETETKLLQQSSGMARGTQPTGPLPGPSTTQNSAVPKVPSFEEWKAMKGHK